MTSHLEDTITQVKALEQMAKLDLPQLIKPRHIAGPMFLEDLQDQISIISPLLFGLLIKQAQQHL